MSPTHTRARQNMLVIGIGCRINLTNRNFLRLLLRLSVNVVCIIEVFRVPYLGFTSLYIPPTRVLKINFVNTFNQTKKIFINIY